MDCPSCGHLNREGARFCAECAASLLDLLTCPGCGDTHPPGAKFCDSCGETLGPAAGADLQSEIPDHLADKIRSTRRSLEGERKQVTVLFADVMGSMDLAESAGAELWQAVMERFFVILCEGVHRFEGTIDKFTGDGVMALFGAPIAHEDHARRAGYAALHLQQQLASYAAELRRTEGLQLLVRIGLNSGEVVVGAIGEDLGMQYTAVGHTVGLAQRMEALAEPGKVYLSKYTAALVSGYLTLSDLGEFQVKGARHPIRVHELTGMGTARGRLDISRVRGLSLFVGRSEELELLASAREHAVDGHAQVVGIVGEAGVGKSRLCHEFVEHQRALGVSVYHVTGQAHAKSVPLMPVLQLMRDYFDITEVDSDQSARERIAGKLLLLDEQFAEDLPLLFDFLGVRDPERPPARMDPEARQRQLLSTTKRLIHAQSTRNPGITLVEDLHWLDPASETFLANLVEAIQGTRALAVVNFRPEYQASWMSRSYYRQIALAPLGPEAIEQLLAGLLGADQSLDGLSQLICERTQGNPFFIEEVVQSLVDRGDLTGERGAYSLVRSIDEIGVPPSVQAVLAARIDRLGQREKTVLQTAAVVGKEFAEPVLGTALDLEPDDLAAALRELVVGEFVFEQELYPEVVYAFKHPLTQEVAYSSQLGNRRATLHAAVARATIAHNGERLAELSPLIAQHWEAAGDRLEAARWHARAGGWTGFNDPTQSLEHWRKVQALTDSLASSAETTELGLAARISQLQFGWRLGLSHEQGEALFHDAERMASESGDVGARALLMLQYGTIRGTTDGDLRAYQELARGAIALAEESGDPALYLTVSLGTWSLFCTGEIDEALAVLDRAIELAAGDPTVAAGTVVGCPYAYCHVFKGGMRAILGDLAEGGRLLDRGIKLARANGDIETVGWGHNWGATRAWLVGDASAADAHAEQSVEIAERLGDSFSRAWAWTALGNASCMQQEWPKAIDSLERSIEISNERRTAVEGQNWRRAALAEAYLGAGDVERASALVAQVLATASTDRLMTFDTLALPTLARVALRLPATGHRTSIDAALTRALQSARDIGLGALVPIIRLELAELARQRGDEGTRQRELEEAHRLFTEIGATPRAEQVTADLATSAA